MKLPFRNKFSSDLLQHVEQRNIYTSPNGLLLPTGFWYGIKGAWMEFLEDERTFDHQAYNYNYEIRFKPGVLTDIAHPDPNKVLVIKTPQEYNTFFQKYLVLPKKSNLSFDWTLLKSQFAGVEIRNYPTIVASQQLSRTDFRTLIIRMFDASSGCVWNVSVIAGVKLAYKREGKKWKPSSSSRSTA